MGYHGKVGNSTKSKGPINGQESLDKSFLLKRKHTGLQTRLAIQNKDEFVVLNEHVSGKFHGHVRTWKELNPQMQEKFVQLGLTNLSGKVLEKIISKL